MHILEITLQRKVETAWPVVARHQPGENALALWSRGQLALDLVALEGFLPTEKEYGEMLGKALFRDDLRDNFTRALAQAGAAGETLRILLIIEADDLRGLRWEQVCAPFDFGWDYFSLNQQTSYQMYLPSQIERRFPPIGRRDLRALVLVAAPEDLSGDYKLAPFDVAATVAGVRASLGEIECDVLSNLPDSAGPPTLDAFCEQLIAKPYTLLHLVCHGAYNKSNGESILYLPKDAASRSPVQASDFIARLNRLNSPRGLPHFTFLCSCESAAPQAENGLGGLGQRLVRDLGMPAVLAMTDRIQIKTAQVLASAFYIRLREHGEVDRALCESLGSLQGKVDVTVPALYSRLGGRALFSDSLNRPLTPSEISYGLETLHSLMTVRAPVLLPELKTHRARIESTLGLDPETLSKETRRELDDSLAVVNELCGEVLDLSFGALALGKQPPAYDARTPFPGLIAFQPADKEFFFGREPLIETLRQRLGEHNFLAVMGASGSGKSSLVLAGLVPALGGEMAYFTPSDSPLERMQAALAGASDKALVVADQFEELFTLTSPEKRQDFIKALLELSRQRKVVVTMRADFWGEVAPYETLRAEIQQYQELVAPMNTEEMRRAMELQAAKVGLRFEADLTLEIIDSIRDEPGAMPLLQHALLLLWQRRHGRWLRSQEYRALGGVQKAIASTADELYSSLAPTERERIRNIFVRLTFVDDAANGEVRDTRRRVGMQELVPVGEDPGVIIGLVSRLANARLVVTSENAISHQQEVEVAHEALIRQWPRLRAWLNEDRTNLRLRDSIRESALEWDAHNRDESFLDHRGARLEEAEKLAQLPRFGLNTLEQTYLTACVNLRESARRQIERRRRWTVGVSLAAALAMAALGIYGFVQGQLATQQKDVAQAKATEAFHAQSTAEVASQKAEAASKNAEQKQKEAEAETRRATAGELALESKSVINDYPARALLLALESVYVNRDAEEPVLPEAEAALRAANETDTGIGLPGFANEVSMIFFSPDSQWLFASSYSGEVKIWDMNEIAAGSLSPFYSHNYEIGGFADIEKDGHWFGIGDRTKSILWTTERFGKNPQGLTFEGEWHNLPGLANTFVTATDTQTFVWTLDPATQSVVSKQTLKGVFRFIGPDNLYVVTFAEGTGSLLWKLTPGALPVQPQVLSAADIANTVYSPDGHRMAGISAQNNVEVWDMTVPANPQRIDIRFPDKIVCATFDEDKKWLVLVYQQDGSKFVDFYPLGKDFTSHVSAPLTFPPDVDSSSIYCSASSGWMRIDIPGDFIGVYFDLSLENPAAHPTTEFPTSSVPEPTQTPTPGPAPRWVIASAQDSTSFTIQDALCKSCTVPISLTGQENVIAIRNTSSDGKWLAGGTADGALRLWRLEELPGPRQYSGDFNDPTYIAFSPDNHWLASGNLLWQLADGHPQGAPIRLSDAQVALAVFSVDGRWMSFLRSDGTSAAPYLLDLEKVRQGELPVPILLGSSKPLSLSLLIFSPDSQWLAISGFSYDIEKQDPAQLWNLADPEKLTQYSLPVGEVSDMAFTPDSRSLLTVSGEEMRFTRNQEISKSYLHTAVTRWELSALGAPLESKTFQFEYAPDRFLLSTNARWLYSEQESILWDLNADFHKFPLLDSEKFYPIYNATFSPGNQQLTFQTIEKSSDAHHSVIVDLNAYESGADETPIIQADYSTSFPNIPLGSPAGRWLIQGPQPSGVGSTLPWSGIGHTKLIVSTLNGRAYQSFVGARGGGGGPGSFKKDFAVGLLQPAPEQAGKSPKTVALRGHESKVSNLVFSPDDHWLATVAEDPLEPLRLWDTEQMWAKPDTRPVLLPVLTGQVQTFGFTADSRWLVVVTSDNVAHFLSTRMEDLIAQACQSVGRNFIINEWERYFPNQPYRQTCPNLPVHPSFDSVAP